MPGSSRNDHQTGACTRSQEILCPSLKVRAGVAVEREGHLLLLQRAASREPFPGAWHLPAGDCEAGEAPRGAAARNAAEATGYQVEVGRLVDAYFYEDDSRGNGLLLVFEARTTGGALCIDRGASSAAGFFAPEGIPSPLSGGGHDQAIEAWRQRARFRWQPGSPMNYCPHCTRSLVKQVAFNRLRSVCLACGFVDFQAPKVGVSLLITDEEGRLLLIRRAIEPAKGKWGLPSGFVDWDESPEEAAMRECVEETGLVASELRLFEVVHYDDDFRGPGINLTYEARVADGILRPGDDAAEARYFASSELPVAEELAFVTHRAFLERWKNS
jgi:8-oxo-dGTP diphosphatase